MALQKSVEDRSGNIGDYWRVDQIHLVRDGGKMEARIHQYKSKADKTGGKMRMEGVKTLVVDIPAAPAKALLDAIYLAAKTERTGEQSQKDDPFFSDAVEV